MALEDFQKLLGLISEAGYKRAEIARGQAEAESLAEYRRQEADFKNRELKQRLDEFNANLGITQALKKAQIVGDVGKSARDYSSFGELPLGATVQSSRTDPDTGYIYHTLKFGSLKDPDTGEPMTTEVMSPQSYGDFLGKQKAAENKPLQDILAQNKSDLAAQQAAYKADQEEQNRKLRSEIADMIDRRTRDIANQNDTTRRDLNDANHRSAMDLLILREINENRRAELRANGGMSPVDQAAFENDVNDVGSGAATEADLKKKYGKNQLLITQILSEARSRGFIPFDQKQKETGASMAAAVNVANLFKEFNDSYKANPHAWMDPSDPAYRNLHLLKNQIDEGLIAAIPALGTTGGRLSDPRVKALQKAYSPTLIEATSPSTWGFNVQDGNEKTLRGFTTFIDKAVEGQYSNLTPQQRGAIKQRIGLAPFLQDQANRVNGQQTPSDFQQLEINRLKNLPQGPQLPGVGASPQ